MNRALRFALLSLGLLGWGSLASATSQGELRRAEVRLRGPLQTPQVRSASGDSLTIQVELRPGEERVLQVPWPLDPDFGERPPEFEQGGSIEVLDLRGDPGAGAPARTLPPVVSASQGPRVTVWGTLALSLVLLLAVRRRPWWGLPIGVALAAAAVYLQAAGPDLAQPPERILEGEQRAGVTSWWQVDVAFDRLRFAAPEEGVDFETSPPMESPPAWWVEPDPVGGFDHWELRAPGRRVALRRRLEPGLRAFAREINRWGNLEDCWVRTPDGRWSNRGAWSLGSPLPEDSQEGGLPSPPGWLASRLPQGRGILVGRLSEGTFQGESGAGDPSRGWIRLVGF